jgi:hypothetical protein
MTSISARQGWRLIAACRDHPDPDIFATPTSLAIVDQARAVCASCPLVARRACLAEARESGDDHTVCAGLTPAQRRRIPRSDQDVLIADPARIRALGYRVRDEARELANA